MNSSEQWRSRIRIICKYAFVDRPLEAIPLKLPRQFKKFDIYASLVNSGFVFQENDVLVISSKYVSISEGSVISLDKVRVSSKAAAMAKKFHIQEQLAEIVLRESDYVLRGMPGYLLTFKNGVLAPNAGIDKSNVPPGFAVLYPSNPFRFAKNLRLKFLINFGTNLAIIVSDSRLMPTRIGTTGIAIGASGFEPVEDQRGKKDLFGNVLRVTIKAIADELATIGVMIMGESNESIPAVIIRGANVRRSGRDINWRDMAIEPENDIYMRSG